LECDYFSGLPLLELTLKPYSNYYCFDIANTIYMCIAVIVFLLQLIFSVLTPIIFYDLNPNIIFTSKDHFFPIFLMISNQFLLIFFMITPDNVIEVLTSIIFSVFVLVYIYIKPPFCSIISNSIYSGVFLIKIIVGILVLILNFVNTSENDWIGSGFFLGILFSVIFCFFFGIFCFIIYSIFILIRFKKNINILKNGGSRKPNLKSLIDGFNFTITFPFANKIPFFKKLIQESLDCFSKLKDELDLNLLLSISAYYIFYEKNYHLSSIFLKKCYGLKKNIFESYVEYLRGRQTDTSNHELTKILNYSKKLQIEIEIETINFWKIFMEDKIKYNIVLSCIKKLNQKIKSLKNIFGNLLINFPKNYIGFFYLKKNLIYKLKKLKSIQVLRRIFTKNFKK
jgi:hypothetical protein